MKKDFGAIFGLICVLLIISYWVLGILFCSGILVYHWYSYATVGETFNHIPLHGLIICSILVPIAYPMIGFGVYMYIKQIKMYNK